MDVHSLFILKNADWKEIRDGRQKVYHIWESYLKKLGLKPVFKALHPGANPWCFPVYVENEREAIRWFEWGYENYYNVFSWPTLPEEIIKKGEISLKRWELLICFDTNQIPKL